MLERVFGKLMEHCTAINADSLLDRELQSIQTYWRVCILPRTKMYDETKSTVCFRSGIRRIRSRWDCGNMTLALKEASYKAQWTSHRAIIDPLCLVQKHITLSSGESKGRAVVDIRALNKISIPDAYRRLQRRGSVSRILRTGNSKHSKCFNKYLQTGPR